MSKKIIEIRSTEDVFSINWIMHLRCNYDCMYCPTARHDNYSSMPSLVELQEHWQQLYNKTNHIGKKYKIGLTGGEVTINRDFLPFVNWLITNYREQLDNLTVLSNGSASLRYYLELLETVDHIVFSTHTEHIELEKFCNIVTSCKQFANDRPGKFVMVNIMEEYWAEKEIKHIINLCKEHNIHYSISKIEHGYPGSRTFPIFKDGERRDLELTKEKDDSLWNTVADYIDVHDVPVDEYYNSEVFYDDGTSTKTFAARLRFLNLHHFKGWECYTGFHRVVVHPDTTVYSGECENLNLGQLSNNTFKLLDGPSICLKDSCTGNPADLNMNKRRLDV